MTKLEEIARAICGPDPVIHYDMEGAVGDEVRSIFLERARAVLSALKTPTPGMIAAGRVAWLESASDYTRLDESISAAFRAMIDAAVGEGR